MTGIGSTLNSADTKKETRERERERERGADWNPDGHRSRTEQSGAAEIGARSASAGLRAVPLPRRRRRAGPLMVVAVAVRPTPHWLCSVWSPACRGMVIRSKAGRRTDGRTDHLSVARTRRLAFRLGIGTQLPQLRLLLLLLHVPSDQAAPLASLIPATPYKAMMRRRERDDRAREKNLIPGTPDAERGTLLSLPPTQSLKLLMMMLGNGTWCGFIYTGTV